MDINKFEELNRDLIAETERIWEEEPYEIVLIRNNVTLTGAGSEGQYFSVLVHLESFLMLLGPHVIYRILYLSNDQEFNLYALKQSTIGILSRPFDQFEFLGDLGLASTHKLGHRYLEAIAEIETREQYVELTSNFLSYFNRIYQWIHLVFPWSVGSQFPKRTLEQAQQIMDAAENWYSDNPQ